MEKNHRIPYGRHHITDEDIQAVAEALKADFITQGANAEIFEKKFAGYVDAKYAVTVSNGTAALHLSAIAIGVKKGDNVIVPPITFAASANCIRYCGGDVTFCDIDKDTYLLDLSALKQLLDSKPKGFFKGVIPVDFAGYPVHGEELRKIADDYGLWIIEDACHAPGAYFTDSNGNSQHTGNGKFAELTCFSFHPVKHIATGEGGMITTNSKELYDKLIRIRSHGITKNPQLMNENHGGWYYEMLELGYNYRMTEFQAALGISQLKRADEGLKRRHEIAHRYDEVFQGIKGIIIPKVSDGFFHAYHLYVIQVEDRKGLYDYLVSNNIFVQIHYIPVHLQPYYKELGWKPGDMSVAEDYYQHCLSLPMYPTLTGEEQNFVIEKVKEFIK